MPTIPDVEMEDADHPDAMEQQPGKTAASDSEEEPAVEDEDIDIEVEPGHCPGCEQKIGTQDQDAIPGTTMLVATPRGGEHSGLALCMKCIYIKRGSFKGLSLSEFLRLKKKCRPLSEKFKTLRRKLVMTLCKNPRARPRHETVDVKMFTTRSTDKYVDFRQEGTWHDLKEYFDNVADDASKKKLRSVAQKKAYLQKMGLHVQQDERGVEGVVIVDGPKKVLFGTRVSAKKQKRTEHADRGGMDQAHTEDSGKLEVDTNTKEDEAKALGQMDEEVEDSEPDQEDAKGSDESSDDGWGVGNKDVKAQLKPKRARQEKLSKEEKQGEGRPSTPAPAPQVPAPQSSAAQSGKVPSTVPKNVDKLVAQATTLVATLQQINPVLVWQNASKLKECEAKMAKSEPFVAALQEAEKTPAVLKVYNDLRVVWNDLGTFTDLIVSTKSSSVETVADANNFMNYIAEYGKDIVKFLGKQTPEFLKIVLCEFGRLFCETNVVPGQLEHGYRASIFQFLSLAKLEGFDTYTIISFGQILEECKKNSKVTIDATFFLQMQSSIFGGLLDRLRTTGDQATRALLSALPQTLCQPDLLRKEIPEDCALDFKVDGFENSTGFGIRVLIDLQKLLLCKLIEGHKGLSPDLYPPDQKKLVKLTVSKLQLFSTKIRLIFRSNALLRTCWQDAVTLAKNVLSDEKSQELAAGVLDSLKKLNSLLASTDCSPNEEFDQLVESCKPALDVEAAMTEADAASEIGKGIQACLNDLRVKVEVPSKESLAKFTKWLETQWVEQESGTTESTTTLEGFQVGSVDEFKEVTPTLLIQGMVFSHVLKQQPEMYMRLIAMIKMLQEYGNSDLTLASSWKLGKGLLEEMHIAKTSLGSGDHGIEWVSAGVSASERLKDLVVKRGPSVVLSLLDPEDKDKIQQAKALLSQMAGITGRLHSIRAVLEEPEAGWDLYSKDPPTDLMGVCKQLVVIVKTVAFDFEVIDQVRPGTKDQVTQYMGNVYTVLGDFVKSTEKQVEQWEKLLQQYKPAVAAAEMWQPEKVAEVGWMFKPNQPQIDNDTKALLNFRDTLPSHLPSMKGITACKAGIKMDPKLNGLANTMLKIQSKVEELNSETATVVGTMMTMEVIINEGNYKDKLATSRKVCSFLSKKLGMSKNDLSPLLKSKFDGLTNPSSAVKSEGSDKNSKAAKRKSPTEEAAPKPKAKSGGKKAKK